ncbi:unnamed protein product [Symbiodinium natans]|uniref:Uncharacterized protein n=1 Tax=Symbiodinium natans TaxID=878477 RepID=A0A812LM91_9DINO|nr:unnamed protein product [Symbiodinium natans]
MKLQWGLVVCRALGVRSGGGGKKDAAHDRDGAGTFGESHKDVCGAGTSRARPGENGTPGGDGAPVVPAAPEDPEPDEGRSGMGNTDGKSLLPSTPQVTELLWLLRRTRSPTKAGRARVTRTADLGPSTSQATEKGTDLPARQSGKPARARELRQANLSMWHAFCRMKKFGRRGQRRANSHLRSGRVTHDAMERSRWAPSTVRAQKCGAALVDRIASANDVCKGIFDITTLGLDPAELNETTFADLYNLLAAALDVPREALDAFRSLIDGWLSFHAELHKEEKKQAKAREVRAKAAAKRAKKEREEEAAKAATALKARRKKKEKENDKKKETRAELKKTKEEGAAEAKAKAQAKLQEIRNKDKDRKAKYRSKQKKKAAEARAKEEARTALRKDMEALAKRPILDEEVDFAMAALAEADPDELSSDEDTADMEDLFGSAAVTQEEEAQVAAAMRASRKPPSDDIWDPKLRLLTAAHRGKASGIGREAVMQRCKGMAEDAYCCNGEGLEVTSRGDGAATMAACCMWSEKKRAIAVLISSDALSSLLHTCLCQIRRRYALWIRAHLGPSVDMIAIHRQALREVADPALRALFRQRLRYHFPALFRLVDM